ncbi:(Fe-S)-binding protein [Citrifermentans bremense]|uniref:(Fe-S)-binding protein n=1 Tax=Citrifermentans bremense TaxID=60035 RepID=UPI000411D9B9|nr:(Fe-S)-binding protein [Citrifermentans bremense]
MNEMISAEIRRFVQEESGNRFGESGERYFDDPLVGFAAADDPLFLEYKEVIGGFHLTPEELAETAEGGCWQPRSVICWVLPITETTRAGNRTETVYPSRAWAQTRHHGEAFNTSLRRHMVRFLVERGHHALAPQLHPGWREYGETPVGIASSWSERHAAYAAGLGTFSLNDALITERGIAHRLGTVITDLALTPSPRPYLHHKINCLWHRNGTCGACIGRCPVGALSKEGHDKRICRDHVYGTIPAKVAEQYQVASTGCGLCQTRVPCEGKIP